VNTVLHIDDARPRVAHHDERITQRREVTVNARLTWKDARGATRFASVVTRNVSEFGVYVEAYTPVNIPLYRLVQIQVEREAASTVPATLQQGRVLSAVYRISPPTASKPQGFALRLMIDPRRVMAAEQARATA
jgi:hypothetical protein